MWHLAALKPWLSHENIYTVMAQQKLECSAVPWDAPMVFHQSTKDISVIMQIEGREGWVQAFEIVVHCDTLLAWW